MQAANAEVVGGWPGCKRNWGSSTSAMLSRSCTETWSMCSADTVTGSNVFNSCTAPLQASSRSCERR
eukprot:1867682-Prorocentrum_lima.AAC.1